MRVRVRAGSLMHYHHEDSGAWVPFLQILVPALSVCFIFTITIGLFPAVTAEVKSSIAGSSAWGEDTVGPPNEGNGLWQDWECGSRDPGLPSPQLDSPGPLALPWAKSISTSQLGTLSPGEGQGC